MSKKIIALLKDAKKRLDDEKFEETISLCREALDLDEKCYNAFALMGAAYFSSGKLNDAAQVFEKAIEIDGDNPLAWQGLGKVYENERMFSKLKRSRIVEVFRFLINYYSKNPTDWLKYLKFYCLLAKTLAFDLTENDLQKEDPSLPLERLSGALTSLQEIWNLMLDHAENTTVAELSSSFELFLSLLQKLCNIKQSNPKLSNCHSLLQDVYKVLFQLDSSINADESQLNIWNDLCHSFSDADLTSHVNHCTILIMEMESTGAQLEDYIWRVMRLHRTSKTVLLYCLLLLEKNIGLFTTIPKITVWICLYLKIVVSPQLGTIQQLVNEEQLIIKAEHLRQTGNRARSFSKFEADTLNLVAGCLSLNDGNKVKALEQLSSISSPDYPVIYVYLSRAFLECGQPTEASASALQGLRHLISKTDNHSKCFYDKAIVASELEALKIFSLLESGTEPSYASFVQETEDLLMKEVNKENETLRYLSARFTASGFTENKFIGKLRDNRRQLEVDMRSLIFKGKADDAIELFDNVNLRGTEDDAFLLAIEALACSYLTEADKISRGANSASLALKVAPKYAIAHWVFGRCLSKLGQMEEAEKHLSEACQLQPLNSQIAYDYCKILFADNRHEECGAIVSSLVSVSTPCQWPYVRLALYHLEQKNSNTAIHLLLAALRCPSMIADAIERMDGVPKHQRLMNLWHSLGTAYMQKGSIASAVRAFTHCGSFTESKKFSPSVACSLAEAHLKLGRPDLAIKCLEEESEITTDKNIHGRKLIQLATAELQIAKTSGCQCAKCVAKQCIKCLELLFARNSPECWNTVAVWKISGDVALLMAEAVDHLPPDSIPAMNESIVQALNIGSESLFDPKGWLLLSCRFYSTALRIDQNSSQLWLDFANAKTKLAKFSKTESEDILKTVIASCQINKGNVFSLALLACCLQQYPAAQHFILNLLPNAGQTPSLLILLALVYISNGNTPKAEEALGYARLMIDAGCVETVTRPSIVPTLHIAEAILKNETLDVKQLVNLLNVASQLPISSSYLLKLAILGQLFRNSVMFFAKTTNLKERETSIQYRMIFDQLLPIIDNFKLTMGSKDSDHMFQTLNGLCGHCVELAPNLGDKFKRSTQFFDSASDAFGWNRFRSKILVEKDKTSCQVPLNFGDRSMLLIILCAFYQKSPNLSEIIEKTEEKFISNLTDSDVLTEIRIAKGIALVLQQSFAPGKQILLKELITLKQAGGQDMLEAKLLSVLGLVATLSNDVQLLNVMTSMNASNRKGFFIFKVFTDNSWHSLLTFAHSHPFDEKTWLFAMRHSLFMSDSQKLQIFQNLAISHLPVRSRSLWTALAKPDDKRSLLKALRARPYEKGLWFLLNGSKSAELLKI